MFPIPFNFPFRKKDGSVTSIGAAIDAGGGSYELPTASANTKGGVKIGTTLEMTDETLNAKSQLPAHTSAEAGKVLTVGDDGSLEWDENGGAGVAVISETDWDALTDNEKRALGLVALQTENSGFNLGYYLDASLYVGNPFIEVSHYTPNATYKISDILLIAGGCKIELNNATGGEGVIIRLNNPALNNFKITGMSTNGGYSQWGVCTSGATLPEIVTQGEGRDSYYANTSHTFNNFDVTKNLFFSCETSSAKDYVFTIELL